MILFEEIYNKAIILFDDDKITNAYKTNKIAFCKHMQGFLDNVSIDEPVIIGQLLSGVSNPIGQMETFQADGETATFILSISIPANSQIIFWENENMVQATQNENTGEVIFPDILASGETYGVEQYFPGSYVADFSIITDDDMIKKDIEIKVKNILSRLLVMAWAESVRNMLTDIQGLVRDTDFQATPNSQILNAKINLINQLRAQNDKDQNKLSWRIKYSGKLRR